MAFTIQNIAEELRDRVDFEIIAVDNWCKEVEQQNRQPDRSHTIIASLSKDNPWLKVLRYNKKLSHWQAKNMGVRNSSGKFLWFVDAHCIISRDALFRMFEYYKSNYEELDGTIHLPLTYHILEWHKLIYQLKTNRDKGEVHYSFRTYKNGKKPYEVPCMSTCGVMITRELLDYLGGWPEGMGIYGGGENFINFTLAILGKKKWIMPGHPLRHHGERRGYHYNIDDYVRNRCLANYMFGGEKWAMRYVEGRKGSNRVLLGLFEQAVASGITQREDIETKQVISIEDWLASWGE